MNSKGFNLPILLAPCSSSSRATEEQTTLYFCVSCCEDPDAPLESYEDHKDWYSINPKQPPNQPYDKLSRVTRMPSSSCFSPTFISSTVLGSKIHVFGAFYTDSDEVPLGPLLLTYDTLTNKWHNNLPHTEADRISPLLVTCGGILFAIGCERTPSVRYPWAECFDQNQNRWISLPNPPIKLGDFSTYPTSSVVLDDTKFLINVSCCPHMLVFDICTWKWTTVDCPDYPKNRSLNCKMVVVGDMLYMFFGCMMYAYNFSKGGKSLKKVRNLDRLPSSIGPPEGEVFPFYLGGGNFCEVWSRHGPGMTSVILCMNFHVNLVTDYRGKKILEATIDGCNSYTVDGGFIKDCVAVTS